ncbi:M50 family metallopeptidase [Litchfieldia salsa]|uniref:Stage IV sporulation protein FB n=1 Tax=Litchfieldia salsa TaxID=930152 RepID=A0A1H0NSL5_9BACI|nr:M50 family metallopeptidase [Litchfieldia salsa]SDO95747.1 stage IV sporulation protein FB [Litchfieldia salsa]
MIKLLSKIHIHPLLWVLIGLAIITAHFRELLMLFVIVFVHEMGHALCAHFFSWRIRRILLLPFGGVAEMEEHGNRPLKEEVLVVLAGPIQHLWMIGLGYGLFSISLISQETLDLFIFQNLMILGFNLLPIWPLDGGKLLFTLFSWRFSFYKSHQFMLTSSIIAIFLFIVGLILINPTQLNLWIIVTFLIYSIALEFKNRHFVLMRFLLERYYGKHRSISMLKPLMVDESVTIQEVLWMFQRGYKHPIIIHKNGRKQPQIDENELLHAYFSEKKTTESIGEVFYSWT